MKPLMPVTRADWWSRRNIKFKWVRGEQKERQWIQPEQAMLLKSYAALGGWRNGVVSRPRQL